MLQVYKGEGGGKFKHEAQSFCTPATQAKWHLQTFTTHMQILAHMETLRYSVLQFFLYKFITLAERGVQKSRQGRLAVLGEIKCRPKYFSFSNDNTVLIQDCNFQTRIHRFQNTAVQVYNVAFGIWVSYMYSYTYRTRNLSWTVTVNGLRDVHCTYVLTLLFFVYVIQSHTVQINCEIPTILYMYIEYNYYCGAYMYLFCLQRLALKDKIYITGCLDAVWEWFRNHLLVVAAVAVAFAFPEVRILSFTCI